MGKGDTLLDVALETLNRGLEEGLLLFGDVAKDVNSPLSTIGLNNCQHRQS